jgi:hypothetical protein
MSSYRYVTLMVGILAASMLASEVSAMYDPGLGRFLSRDPIGFEGESPSLYQYVQSSPTYYLDPFGLIRKLPPCKQIPKLDPKDPPVMPTYPTGLPDPIDPRDPWAKPKGNVTTGYLVIFCKNKKGDVTDQGYIPLVSRYENSVRPGGEGEGEPGKSSAYHDVEQQCLYLQQQFLADKNVAQPKDPCDFSKCEFHCFINNNPCAECEKIIDVPIYQCPDGEPVVLPDGSFNPKCKKIKPKER